MGGLPIDAPALLASGEPLMVVINERRNKASHGLAFDRMQHRVASRAAAKRAAVRVEGKAREHLAKLIAEPVARQESDVRRRAQPLVAGKGDPRFGTSVAKELTAAQGRIPRHVGAQQSKPSCEPPQHPVGRKPWGFFHVTVVSIATLPCGSPRKPGGAAGEFACKFAGA